MIHGGSSASSSHYFGGSYVILKFSLLTRIIKSLWNKRTELIFGSKFYFRRS